MATTPAQTPAHLARYIVQSSDVLSDMRLNISEEGSERIIWYKERFLSDDEIVEHVVENATSTLQWSIHRPKRGWYIHIRSPSFPPGVHISLTPLPQSSPYHAEAALSFSCRTNAPPTYPGTAAGSSALPKTSTDSDDTLTTDPAPHSYPPTPPTNPAVRVHPPSPRSVHARLVSIPPAAPITSFVLTPHSLAHVPVAQPSLFGRVVAALKNHVPSHSLSFTLSPLPVGSPDTEAPPPTPEPLLTYHDRTPVWTARTIHGVLELDAHRAQEIGVQTSFHVAVALTYLEFLMDRESFLAATAD
ncbi:hypothetical protein PHLGIDRAFT_452655 [Phlebiopsis gigantea 11061_1 CR5-6]|uniref:Uncharacterized protein n=1 Tax=Phlebiopsis gigantea (strain 11061_1 CR5-6) TaxID=745531 RepID=A0A0C3RXH0_PHLG1|nr:hypothetical protein PHLGIDRAFT_452655 [Phlebiopsis gigantea 11061_1 CR5-6]